MIKISSNQQVIFYAAILIFGVLFFFYFYRQASLTESGLSAANVVSGQANQTFFKEGVNLNLDFFKSDKFLKLRSDMAPNQSFLEGKRNPFLPD
jgi:hypothetical protein